MIDVLTAAPDVSRPTTPELNGTEPVVRHETVLPSSYSYAKRFSARVYMHVQRDRPGWLHSASSEQLDKWSREEHG